MIIQIIKFESELPTDEALAIAKKRVPEFQALPGLLQKYYVKLNEPNQFGGIYVWDSAESLAAFRESELAATIPQAYRVKGKPSIEILEGLFQLRD